MMNAIQPQRRVLEALYGRSYRTGVSLVATARKLKTADVCFCCAHACQGKSLSMEIISAFPRGKGTNGAKGDCRLQLPCFHLLNETWDVILLSVNTFVSLIAFHADET